MGAADASELLPVKRTQQLQLIEVQLPSSGGVQALGCQRALLGLSSECRKALPSAALCNKPTRMQEQQAYNDRIGSTRWTEIGMESAWHPLGSWASCWRCAPSRRVL